MKSLCCQTKACPHAQKAGARNIIRHGFYKTKWGKRRRYRCRICGTTFCSNNGQVIKTRRNDRIIQVERRAMIGAPWRFEEALLTPSTPQN